MFLVDFYIDQRLSRVIGENVQALENFSIFVASSAIFVRPRIQSLADVLRKMTVGWNVPQHPLLSLW